MRTQPPAFNNPLLYGVYHINRIADTATQSRERTQLCKPELAKALRCVTAQLCLARACFHTCTYRWHSTVCWYRAMLPLCKHLLLACAGFNAVSQQDGKLNDVAKGAADATQKAAQNITPDLSELPNPTNLPNPFDDTGFADKVLLKILSRLDVPYKAAGMSSCSSRVNMRGH